MDKMMKILMFVKVASQTKTEARSVNYSWEAETNSQKRTNGFHSLINGQNAAGKARQKQLIASGA